MIFDIVELLKMVEKRKFFGIIFVYIKIKLYLCGAKVYILLNLDIMFGVKSSNQPISGQFAEEFCKHLIEMKEQVDQHATKMSHNIICGIED